MSEPIERVRRFVEAQQQQACLAEGQAAWLHKVKELLPGVEAIVVAMRESLADNQFQEPVLSVLSDTSRAQFPLAIAFGGRPKQEIGASVQFRCEPDGHVHGFRYPFHNAMKTGRPEAFVDLGDPCDVQPEDLGNAVAEFLEWATVGGGCGGRAVQFAMPETLPFARPTVKMSMRAA